MGNLHNTPMRSLTSVAKQISERVGYLVEPTDLIQQGAQCKFPIYWRNGLQEFSVLIGFGPNVSARERAVRAMQLCSRDLGRLELEETVTTSAFEPTDDDWRHLESAGSSDGQRFTVAPVDVRRDQLFLTKEGAALAVELFVSSEEDDSDSSSVSDRAHADTIHSEPAKPAPTHSSRRRGWKYYAFDFVAEQQTKYRFRRAKELYKHLRKLAAQNEGPFELHLGSYSELVLKASGSTVALKTLQNAWGPIRNSVRQRLPGTTP